MSAPVPATVQDMDIEDARQALPDALSDQPQLRILVVLGSRARGTHHERSDWDLGYLADEELDPLALREVVAATLGTDDLDLVDLDRASGLLRFQAASEARVIIENPPASWERFVLDATLFWCDAGPVIQRAYDAVLEDLSS